MRLPIQFSLTRVLVPLFCALSVSSCSDALVFAEESGFNLGININDEPSTPLQLNAGLERTVLAFAPPRGESGENSKGKVEGDAVSLFSGFRLTDNHASQGTFAGTLRIRTQFASGIAAQHVAGNPKAVGAITNIKVRYKPDANTAKLRRYKDQSEQNKKDLKDWMKSNNVKTKFIETFLVSDKHKQKRADAVVHFRL